MARSFTTFIPETDCIGDSLNPINTNYLNLDEECQRLDTRITSASSSLITTAQTLSVLNPVDTTTVDLTWTASTRSLQAAVKNSSISTTQLAASAVTAEILNGGQSGLAPVFGIRAWVSFNSQQNSAGTANTTNGTNRFIKAQGNVSSVLMNAIGDYTITFTQPMPDTNYCVVGTYSSTNDGTAGDQTGWVTLVDDQNTPKTVSTVRVGAFYANSAYATIHPNEISVMIIR